VDKEEFMKKVAIMGAMPEEINGILALLENKKETKRAMRTFYTGTVNGYEVTVCFSRWGKTAASVTAGALIGHFGAEEVIFTGVAGALSPDLNIGDIVVAKRLVHHDLDARPLMPRHEIPLLDKTFLEVPAQQFERAQKAVNAVLGDNLRDIFTPVELRRFNIKKPKLVSGDVASGDKFFASDEQKRELLAALPGSLCVEMEGAAVAQVCYEYGVPFTVIRTISDAANNKAEMDFVGFINTITGKYSREIIKNLLK